jgi:predicted RNase H-like nuclease (RuvC/YqgF family)
MKEKGPKIERLRKETEKLRRENEELKRELNELKKEFEEYKKRHPETVGVKHEKPYSFRASAESGRMPGSADRVL